MKNNKYGFTLIELLAVIVILAIISVIAVPIVISVIEEVRKETLESTAKMIASYAEKTKSQNAVLGKTEDITCENVASLNSADYESCAIEFDGNTANVTIKGKGKFEGLYVCAGTNTGAVVQKYSCTAVNLTVNPNGGTNTARYSEKYESKEEVVLTPPTRKRYEFIGWEVVSGTEASIEGNILTMGSNATEVRALWKLVFAAAEVGNTKYENIDEAIANWIGGSTLTLLEDVTLTGVIKLNSNEHHILNLGRYTMTAASGQHAIEIVSQGQTSATNCLTINADSSAPGGITATGKSCIYYRKSDTASDRPIITINGGVFTGSYAINSYSSNAGTNCPQYNLYGGVYNGNVSLTKARMMIYGGTFNGWINCTGDSTAYRLISGGTFKSWQFMTTGSSKFTVGTTSNNYNTGVYVDDNGYLVVGGPVITEPNVKFKAFTTNYSGWSSYLQYSSVEQHGLYYTNANEALVDNNKSTGVVTIYTDTLDLTKLNYKGTINIPEDVNKLVITFMDGIEPSWAVITSAEGKEITFTDVLANGIVTRTYNIS